MSTSMCRHASIEWDTVTRTMTTPEYMHGVCACCGKSFRMERSKWEKKQLKGEVK